jgi:sulfite exporter TauE/SafE
VLVTGLTTGGLSCLAVQGGLLATSLRDEQALASGMARERIIGSFLVAKVLAYTLLGALLGLFGSAAQLSVSTRGALQLAIGLFMLATGVRMLWPHPLLRFTVLEPPLAARRMIRRISRSPDGATTPIFLGALTVLIPCGVTQAMMATAIATASPVAGACVMAVFTLATSPLFFGISYLASSIGAALQRYLNLAVAVLIIVLGYLAIQTGATLVGHPLPFQLLGSSASGGQVTAHSAAPGGIQSARVVVRADGYSPGRVVFAAGAPAELLLVTEHITSCTRTINIPALNVQQVLKVTGTTVVRIPPRAAGTRLGWTCGMGMYTGTMSFRAP